MQVKNDDELIRGTLLEESMLDVGEDDVQLLSLS